MCSDIYKHLSNLSLSFMVVYILLMLFFIILFCLSSASLTSIQKGQVSRVFPFSVLLGFTFVGSVITNLFAIYKTGGWTGYIIYNDAFYQHAGAMVWNKFKIYISIFGVNNRKYTSKIKKKTEYRGGQYCRKFFGKKIRQYGAPLLYWGPI